MNNCLTFRSFFPVPLPCWGEVCVALATTKWYRLRTRTFIFVQVCTNTFFQSKQIYELTIGRIGNEMHFRWRGLGWRYLKKYSSIMLNRTIWYLKYTKLILMESINHNSVYINIYYTCRSVFSSCCRNANLAAACFCAGVS